MVRGVKEHNRVVAKLRGRRSPHMSVATDRAKVTTKIATLRLRLEGALWIGWSWVLEYLYTIPKDCWRPLTIYLHEFFRVPSRNFPKPSSFVEVASPSIQMDSINGWLHARDIRTRREDDIVRRVGIPRLKWVLRAELRFVNRAS
jgi:hypothetical protein